MKKHEKKDLGNATRDQRKVKYLGENQEGKDPGKDIDVTKRTPGSIEERAEGIMGKEGRGTDGVGEDGVCWERVRGREAWGIRGK